MLDVVIFIFGTIVTLVVAGVMTLLLVAQSQDGRRQRQTRPIPTGNRELLGAVNPADSLRS